MLAMPAEIEKMQKTESVENMEIEYNELEPFYDKVLKRLNSFLTV